LQLGRASRWRAQQRPNRSSNALRVSVVPVAIGDEGAQRRGAASTASMH
jgi:hypothetical protein